MSSTPQNTPNPTVEFTILMPCLNESETLATCIRKAHSGLKDAGVTDYEIIIADNGSDDGSQDIAREEGARVVDVPVRGYGAALIGGINAAEGKYILMGDSDDSYDWSSITPFIEKLREGYQVVMGTRLKGTILKGAMPFLHRYLGNPVLTFIGKVLFNSKASDFHCGLRGFETKSIRSLDLHTTGMEFATEMVAKAALNKLTMAEVPITYYPDGRSGGTHLRTWRDGWRHLTFMFLMSPDWVFLYPSLVIFAIGAVLMGITLPAPLTVGTITFDVHTLLIAGTLITLAYQILMLWGISRLVAQQMRLIPTPRSIQALSERFSLNSGLMLGAVITLVGIFVILYSVFVWSEVGFQELNYQTMLRILIPGIVAITIGIETIFASFVLALLNLRQIYNQ